MDNALSLAIVAAAAGIPALLIPVLNAMLTGRRDAKAKVAADLRQDVLQERADARADKLEQATRQVAAKLQVNTEAAAASNAQILSSQKQIHKLVNSDRTSGIRDQLDSREIALTLLLELIELKKGLPVPQQPTIETLATVEQMRATIIEQRANLNDRLKQQATLDNEAKGVALSVVK